MNDRIEKLIVGVLVFIMLVFIAVVLGVLTF